MEVLLAAAATPATPRPSESAPDATDAAPTAPPVPTVPDAGAPLPPPTPLPAAPVPAPPTVDVVALVRELVPDPTLTELLDVVLADDDLPRLLRLLPTADLYLQDEVDIALLPTLTRVWSRKGRRGQRHVETPGKHTKQYGFGLVDWRDGWVDWALAPGRTAAPFCAQLRRAVARSRARGRRAMILCDNLGIHTPTKSKLLRALQTELGEDLILVYTPRYDPDSNRIEWLWRALRRAVTHCHQRQTLPPLLADATAWAAALTPEAALSHLGSPFAPEPKVPRRPRRLHATKARQVTAGQPRRSPATVVHAA